MKKIYKIKVENKTYEVEVESISEVAGNVVSTAAPAAAAPAPVAAAPVAASGERSEVKAPMPGVVFDIKVNVGDAVTRGQVVAVLEAMKMETEILSEVDGKVTEIKAPKGTNVVLDDLILTIN